MNALPFDAVVIRRGETRGHYSAYDFLRLPLTERIQVILERRVEFLREGEPVDRSVALQSLMGPPRTER
jgi:hypothetical protein